MAITNEQIIIDFSSPIDDIAYTLIVPKYDNNNRKIKTSIITRFAKRMAKQFNGVTVHPTVLGCWTDNNNELICEENVQIYSIRDTEQLPHMDKQALTVQDIEFMNELAQEVGKELGQASVLVSHARTEITFVSGAYQPELPANKVGTDFFSKLI